MRYAVVLNNVIVRYEEINPPITGSKLIGGLPIMRPVTQTTVNTSTGPDIVTTVSAPTINPTTVVITTTIRDMTAQEILDRDNAIKDSAMLAVDRNLDIIKALGATLFSLTNDVRVLKGQGTITAAQFKAALRAQL